MPTRRFSGGIDPAGAGHDLVGDHDAARVGLLEARDHPQQRRLAAARRPEHRHQLAALDLEVQLADGLDRAERLRQAAHPHVAHTGATSGSSTQAGAAGDASTSPPPARPDILIISATGSRPTSTIRSAGSAAVLEERLGGGLPDGDGERVAAERPQEQRGGQLLHHLHEDEQRGRDEAGAEQRHVHAREHVEAVGAEPAGGVVELARDAQQARLDRAPGEGEEANDVGVEESDHCAGEQ